MQKNKNPKKINPGMRVFLQYFSTFPQRKKKNEPLFPPLTPEDVQKAQAMNEGSSLFGLRNGIQRWRMTRKEKKYDNAIIRRALVRGGSRREVKAAGMKSTVENESQMQGERRVR